MIEDDGRMKLRNCLRCRSSFHSEHYGHRLCDQCRDQIARGAAEVEVPDTELQISELASMATPFGLQR